MAKLTVYLRQPDEYYPFGTFGLPTLGRHSGTLATFSESGGTDRLEIRGKGLTYENNTLVEGTITSMVHVNAEGEKFCSISGVKFNAENLADYSTSAFAFYSGEAMLKGNDKITGSNGDEALEGRGGKDVIKGLAGDDLIYGNTGNDRLTGGAGADSFYFVPGDGHDVITDFNSKGADLDLHDHIIVQGYPHTVRQVGDDTVIRFDAQNSITLLDFRASSLDPSDIQ